MKEGKENTRLFQVQDSDNVNYLMVRKKQSKKNRNSFRLCMSLAVIAPDLPQQLLKDQELLPGIGAQREIPLPRPLQCQPALSKAKIKQLLKPF